MGGNGLRDSAETEQRTEGKEGGWDCLDKEPVRVGLGG